jgi:signal peptidase I
MEPGIRHGDALVIAPASGRDVVPGDIVLFVRSGLPILHRVIDTGVNTAGATYIVTRGDNTREADAPIGLDDVQGRLAGSVPYAGAASRALGIENGYTLIWWVILATAAVCCLALMRLVGRGAASRAAYVIDGEAWSRR